MIIWLKTDLHFSLAYNLVDYIFIFLRCSYFVMDLLLPFPYSDTCFSYYLYCSIAIEYCFHCSHLFCILQYHLKSFFKAHNGGRTQVPYIKIG